MENEKWQEDANEKRPQRPRFTRVERAYSANGSTGERAFRPQGFDVPSGNGEHLRQDRRRSQKVDRASCHRAGTALGVRENRDHPFLRVVFREKQGLRQQAAGTSSVCRSRADSRAPDRF